jgi:hypothetical protein
MPLLKREWYVCMYVCMYMFYVAAFLRGKNICCTLYSEVKIYSYIVYVMVFFYSVTTHTYKKEFEKFLTA